MRKGAALIAAALLLVTPAWHSGPVQSPGSAPAAVNKAESLSISRRERSLRRKH